MGVIKHRVINIEAGLLVFVSRTKSMLSLGEEGNQEALWIAKGRLESAQKGLAGLAMLAIVSSTCGPLRARGPAGRRGGCGGTPQLDSLCNDDEINYFYLAFWLTQIDK